MTYFLLQVALNITKCPPLPAFLPLPYPDVPILKLTVMAVTAMFYCEKYSEEGKPEKHFTPDKLNSSIP
jgi:hypothetical protein